MLAADRMRCRRVLRNVSELLEEGSGGCICGCFSELCLLMSELMNNCRYFWSTRNREDCYSRCDCQRIEKDGGVQCACPFFFLSLLLS